MGDHLVCNMEYEILNDEGKGKERLGTYRWDKKLPFYIIWCYKGGSITKYSTEIDAIVDAGDNKGGVQNPFQLITNSIPPQGAKVLRVQRGCLSSILRIFLDQRKTNGGFLCFSIYPL